MGEPTLSAQPCLLTWHNNLLDPCFLLGDLSGEATSFPALAEAVHQHNLIDVGMQAQRWGRTQADITCTAHGTHLPTRRDFIFANTASYQHITPF